MSYTNEYVWQLDGIKAFTGNTIEGWYAQYHRNEFTEGYSRQIVRVFMYDERPGGGKIHGPMKRSTMIAFNISIKVISRR